MNQLLQQAFERASALPADDQEKFARFMLDQLTSESRWEELFKRPESQNLLDRLADEALGNHRAGQTQPMNPDDL